MVDVIFLEETEFASRGTSNMLVVATSFADQSRSACLAMALQLTCLKPQPVGSGCHRAFSPGISV